MDKLQKILSLVEEYAEENILNKEWQEGDWVNYSGPNFSSDEYVAAVKTLLDGWLVIGGKSRKFEDSLSN